MSSKLYLTQRFSLDREGNPPLESGKCENGGKITFVEPNLINYNDHEAGLCRQ